MMGVDLFSLDNEVDPDIELADDVTVERSQGQDQALSIGPQVKATA